MSEDSLQHDEVLVALGRFDNAKIVHISVTIEVEIGDMHFFAVELLLKFCQISTLPEERGDRFQVEAF